MSAELSNDRDENRIGAVLRAVDADPLPPDRALLAALRERSAEAFTATAAAPPDPLPPASPATERQIAPAPAIRKPRNPMLTLALRGLAVLAATAAAVAGLFTFAPSNSLSGATRFSEVLKELRDAKTLQLQVTKDGKTAEVWVRAPGLVRWQETPQRYEIAAGSRLWKIDEQANTVTTGDSPWFISPTKQIDLLGLLDVGVKEASPLLMARPVERAPFDGRDCFVYRVELPTDRGQVQIEAMADAKSKQLVEIVARVAGAPANAGPPLAEMRLVAFDVPVDDSKFIVAKSLTDDGRIGKVTDAQGVVVVRPILAQRWTPVCRQMQLRPGDWLRTDLRGANAVKVRLSSDVELTLGPASLLECVSPTQARLHAGEIQVNLPKQEHPQFELLAPRAGSQKFTAAGKSLVRVDRAEQLATVKDSPKWLLGFEGASSDESLGSLIVNLPDGRNEPLSIGYHKVSVEIRDQIARTTIEESFVNNTNGRLEGIFNFPLPQDASISGFGMWIGNDLIEADVVEKQRAREIYETILREKRDPGLLEWTGGNIFKARVFPIEPNSEKRVKIVYTQVLPLRADQYRYTYGLRSEMLRIKPLRELSLTVTVNSALPLKSVTCPTHSARISQTAHSAQVEFTAQEYTPSRDFEVLAQIDGRQSDVVVIPHRRGSDGYFLVQLTPPAPEGNWQREVIADGAPLSVVLLCDTSASMDSQKRREQAEFVATVLASLGEKDHFWLAACDVGTVWASPEPLAPTAENIAKARDFLDQRVSLGWTNLERAFGDVLKKSPAGAQVVYIGDGIVTAGQSDPAEFVNRLGRLIGAAAKGADKPAGRVFHAVTVGNSFESTVLKGIAALGGGSVRSIGGDETPQTVALQWLGEITQPGLRDLNVEFRGLKVAAVYPDRLPNLAAGTQQILVGRYLPTGQDQQGEVIVTGHRGSETVRYAAKINLKDAEAGNSFIPRLWARAHLDHLLSQGQSTAIHDQIVALSEEFHIITPYTSLLVLETDADRQRFGVKRQFEMRNGEQFFAAGHDNAQYELLQQQMKRAGDWRIGLRRQILASLNRLGRDPRMFQRRQEMLGRAVHGGEWGFGGGLPSSGTVYLGGLSSYSGATSLANGTLSLNRLSDLGEVEYASDKDGMAVDFGFDARGGEPEQVAAQADYFDTNGEVARESLALGLNDESEKDVKLVEARDEDVTVSDPMSAATSAGDMPGLETPLSDESPVSFSLSSGLEPAARPMGSTPYVISGPVAFSERGTEVTGKSLLGWGGGAQYYRPNYGTWLDTLFPALAPPPPKTIPPRKRPKTWPPEALALADSLLRTESLWKLKGGVELRRVSEGFDPRWKRRSSHSSDLVLYAPTAWLTRSLDLDVQTLVEYCNAKERGVYSLALLLGRSRASAAQELKTPPLGLGDWSLTPLDEGFPGYDAKVEKTDQPNQVVLILTAPSSADDEPIQVEPAAAGDERNEFRSTGASGARLTIDTARHVLLMVENFDHGKLISSSTYADFVELGGSWWARRVTSFDDKARKTAETTLDVQLLTPEKYEQRMAAELTAKKVVQFLHLPGPRLKDARQHVADGSASFDDLVTMMLYDCGLQQWDELLKHLTAAEKLTADKPGVRWLRTVILATIRRNDEARQRLLEEAHKLADHQQQDDVYLADFIFGQAQNVTSPDEFMQFVELLKPVYERQPAELNSLGRWQEQLLNTYDRLSRNDEALALRRTLAEQVPWDVSRQIDFARHLLGAGQSAAAYAWLQQELDRPIEWQASEDESLRTAIADLYRTEVRWTDLLRYTTAWIVRKPEYSSAYLQHLSALLYNDQLDAANALTQQWLNEARIVGKLAVDKQARLDAAISFAQGSAYNVSFYRMDERWFEPLAEEARFFARSKRHFSVVERIMQSNFTESDACDRLRGLFLKLLETDSASLTPEQLRFLIGWTFNGRIALAEPIGDRKQLNASEVPDEVWKKIAATLRQRWAKAVDKPGRNEKAELGENLRTIYGQRFADSELLPFLRERIMSATAEQKPGYIAALFDALFSPRWTEALEQEAFALLPQLTAGNDEPDQRFVQVPALYRLVDRMIAGRIAAAEQELHDKGNVDKLTRTELAHKKADIRKAARAGVAARLAAAAAADLKGPLASWLRIERAYLDVQLEQNLAQVEAECWKIMGEAPPKPADPDAAEELTPIQLRQRAFDALLRQRAFATLMNLAARRDAKPAAIDRVLKYIDAGIAQAGDNAAVWRVTKFQFLVALDRPDDLDRQLREWTRSDVSTAPWRKNLALLVADRGKLDEAIGLFEAAEKDHLLTAADYRTLADWYMAVNRREAYERSRVEAFKLMPEQRLYRIVAVARNLWNQTGQPLPSELDENTLFAYRAIFEKSAQPENYAWMLRDLYAACRDFRLLEILPDAALGRSPQQIYSYLQNLQSQVLYELRNEASADTIIARIKKLRDGKLTSTDQRALDLLEALVERHSSEVLNQTGPHVAACLAALQRAFDRPWSDGEPRLMASFLRNLGTLPNPKLADEQLRELRALAEHAPAGRDHLAIVSELSNLLFWSYNRRDEALDLMQAEVRSYEQAHAGHWPFEDDDILSNYIMTFEGAGRHAAGEVVLQKYLAHPEHEQQRIWLLDRLFALYNHALEHDGEVSLGRGDELFLNLIAAGLRQLDAAADENSRQNLVSRLVVTFDTANRHKLPHTAVELRKFAFDTMPALLKKQQSQYSNTAQTPTGVINEVLGPKAALEYIVDRMEQYPPWLEVTWNNAWNTFGYELARRRDEAASANLNIEALEPRVLKLTLRELKRDLRTGESRNPVIYRINNQFFWSAKAGDFANAAEEVYREYKSSGRRVLFIAQYFWYGLNRHDRAIEMLLVAHAAGVLDEGADTNLVDYLQQEKRYAESIPILEPLVKDHPDNINYRAQLMVAYFQSHRPEQLATLVKATDAYFHQSGRWTAANISVFAEAALNCNLLKTAVGYYNEAISLYQRANPARGTGDQTLSSMYQNLASAQSRLGHTKEAVEAASGAIVCWGPQYSQRTDALNRLKQVLTDAKDLDAYVAGLDKEAAKTGQDSPILRKALGQVYQTRGLFGKAIAQFQLALDLQPSDKEVEQALIACYDATGQRDAATRQLLKLLDLDAHNLALYQQLAERLKDNEAEAERAATSLVEAGPNEAENHAALAELRQKQGRWNEAIEQWQAAADLRRLEPTGLVKLAEAQLHQQQWDAARQSIRKLERTEWPSRFNTIENDIRRLQAALPK